MGYSKARTLTQIRIPLTVNVMSEDGSAVESVQVAHIFNIPSAADREEYNRRLLIIKGKKIKQGSRSDASFYLWKRCIHSVEGYDDLPIIDKDGAWMSYFNDDICRIHIDGAIDALMEVVNTEEGEDLKKSEPSSEF